KPGLSDEDRKIQANHLKNRIELLKEQAKHFREFILINEPSPPAAPTPAPQSSSSTVPSANPVAPSATVEFAQTPPAGDSEPRKLSTFERWVWVGGKRAPD